MVLELPELGYQSVFLKFNMLMVRCHVDEKNGVLELGELEYHKRWYIPNYFRNSVSDPIISKLSANGPFWPNKRYTNTIPDSAHHQMDFPKIKLWLSTFLKITLQPQTFPNFILTLRLYKTAFSTLKFPKHLFDP